MTLGASADRSSRNDGIDGLRAIAALLVLLFHLDVFLGVLSLGPLSRGGLVGVAIFFTLSAFLLYRPMREGATDLRRYAVHRIVRIWPAYLIALVILTAVMHAQGPLQAPIVFALFAQNYVPGLGFEVIGQSWTLTVEVAFYAVLPLIAALAARRGTPVLIGLAAASLAGRAGVAALMPGTAYERALVLNLMPLLLWLFIPGLLAVRHRERLARLPSWSGWACIAAALVMSPTVEQVRATPVLADVAAGTAVSLLASIGAALLLAHGVRLPAALGLFGRTLSYPVYLWHLDIIVLMAGFAIPAMVAGGVAVALTMVLALLSWRLVERPAMRLLRDRGQRHALAVAGTR